ncbi:hypothetical protein [Kistimonas asteriae]|uniref:hypothetical protein n=1 Tax=Kistimonas asteriae TaxID=517724 RepID=UPI001BAC500B|nr:hypothetical protein [Kistimonas asteriae]
MKRWLLILVVLGGLLRWWGSRPIDYGPGVLVNEVPEQSRLLMTNDFDWNNYQVEPIAEFSLKARVLGREDYRLGREADISPTDLALGWGVMSDYAVLEQIRISQRNRFYYWSVDSFPVPRRQIETNSANMHMIPANEYVADQLDEVVEGDIVHIRGKLVNVKGADGWYWNSSLSREDTGRGACELVWVEDLWIEKV